MDCFQNSQGKSILLAIVKAIQENKTYLGDIDGLIGDGDHGMNMNKGFTLFEQRFLSSNEEISFSQGLFELGNILFSEIGGSMGPIYGTIFMDMSHAGEEFETIGTSELTVMLQAGYDGLCEIIEAKVGDKTLVDTLSPAITALSAGGSLLEALSRMKKAAEDGKDSTKNLAAKFGRSSRLGERSRGVLDAGAVSCFFILNAMADGILELIK